MWFKLGDSSGVKFGIDICEIPYMCMLYIVLNCVCFSYLGVPCCICFHQNGQFTSPSHLGLGAINGQWQDLQALAILCWFSKVISTPLRNLKIFFGKGYSFMFFSCCSECEALFGPETLQPISRDDQVFCEMEYSKIVPLEGGEVRPSVEECSY